MFPIRRREKRQRRLLYIFNWLGFQNCGSLVRIRSRRRRPNGIFSSHMRLVRHDRFAPSSQSFEQQEEVPASSQPASRFTIVLLSGLCPQYVAFPKQTRRSVPPRRTLSKQPFGPDHRSEEVEVRRRHDAWLPMTLCDHVVNDFDSTNFFFIGCCD